jgi:hypothetical protein
VLLSSPDVLAFLSLSVVGAEFSVLCCCLDLNLFPYPNPTPPPMNPMPRDLGRETFGALHYVPFGSSAVSLLRFVGYTYAGFETLDLLCSDQRADATLGFREQVFLVISSCCALRIIPPFCRCLFSKSIWFSAMLESHQSLLAIYSDDVRYS